MFTYVDADPSRPSLAELLDDYWNLNAKVPGPRFHRRRGATQGAVRVLPTRTGTPRFPARWGPGNANRGRERDAVAAIVWRFSRSPATYIPGSPTPWRTALLSDLLDRECLAAMNQYQPALSASWLFQKCMSVSPGTSAPRRVHKQADAGQHRGDVLAR